MKKKKNTSAQALSALRWKGKSAAEKKAHSDAMNAARMLATTPEQRVAAAKKAVAARIAKQKKRPHREHVIHQRIGLRFDCEINGAWDQAGTRFTPKGPSVAKQRSD